MRAYDRFFKNREEKLKEINENQKEIQKEINDNFKITITESTKYKESICVTCGLINEVYNSFEGTNEDIISLIKENIEGNLVYNSEEKTLEIHLPKSYYFSSWTISNAIKEVLIQLLFITYYPV